MPFQIIFAIAALACAGLIFVLAELHKRPNWLAAGVFGGMIGGSLASIAIYVLSILFPI